MVLRSAVAVLLFIFAAPLMAEPAAPKLTAAEQSELQHNIELGTLLFRYDQSAWHVTDAALAALPDDMKSRIRGYVTTPAPNGLRTTFFGDGDLGYQMLYSAVWTGAKIESVVVYTAGQQTTLTEDELRLVNARKIALEGAGSLSMCSQASPNVIVVPEGSDPTIHVYVLTPQTENDAYPLGGHHRIDVREGHIVSKRAFTTSCILLSTKGTATEEVAALAITHLLDQIPAEIHVFAMLAMAKPLVVAVPDGRVFSLYAPKGQPQVELIDKQK